ncbi:hypothetical protein N4T77_12025 [Clostridium sp. CX1]|uniref:Iron-only hydrogenase system regulator n=1 Tax=Clostridium tanneri TaxID=3037988 RepID=A0ABU4JXP5_9CLOT|nr:MULTISPECIES: hypothetical protein [unclassified Clostridium]MCT8977328.1 hypothetical protein [Clostridium sp. CX1]MDW8802933.1 hypothetical protein [Clostridium sp. A1-XYC3]
MESVIMALTIDPRTAHAPQVQTVLTKHGCIIKTRIGLHEVHSDHCSEKGLIILHICAELDKIKDLERELLDVKGVSVKYMTL